MTILIVNFCRRGRDLLIFVQFHEISEICSFIVLKDIIYEYDINLQVDFSEISIFTTYAPVGQNLEKLLLKLPVSICEYFTLNNMIQYSFKEILIVYRIICIFSVITGAEKSSVYRLFLALRAYCFHKNGFLGACFCRLDNSP